MFSLLLSQIFSRFLRLFRKGSVLSQIFVRIDRSQVITISIDLFTSGHNLVRVLTENLAEDAEKYRILFGTKKVFIYLQNTCDVKIKYFSSQKKYPGSVRSCRFNLSAYKI